MIAFSLLRFPIRSPAQCGWSSTRPFLGKALWPRGTMLWEWGWGSGRHRVHVAQSLWWDVWPPCSCCSVALTLISSARSCSAGHVRELRLSGGPQGPRTTWQRGC